MRVLAMSSYYPPEISGAGAYLSAVCERAARDGEDVTVLVSRTDNESGTSNGVQVASVAARVRGATSLLMVFRALRVHHRSPVDVVISGLAYPTGVVGLVVATVIRRPLMTLAMGEDVTIARRSPFARWCLPRVFRHSWQVVAISEHTRREAVHCGADASGIAVIAPTIDVRPFIDVDHAAGERFRRATGLEGRRIVLTAARLEERKGHDVTIRAIANLVAEFPTVHYVIVGQGDPTRLQTLAREHGIDDRLTIISELDAAAYPVAFAAAEIFIMVSRANEQGEMDGFGIVYLEAAAAGLPCVAGTIGGCVEAVEDGVTGLCVDPTSDEAVADALRALLASPSRAVAMGAAGRARVRARYGADEQARAFATLLARVPRTRPRSRR